MIRRPLTVAAAGVAGLLGLAACGSDSSEPTVRAASPAPQAVTPFDVYYDLTHPDVATAAGPAAQVASPFDVYYDLTHPDVVNIRTRAPESVNQLEHRANVAWENQVLSQLADLAEEEGLTGLSPAFLQPIPQPIKR
jgi:hypothetical protein